MVRKIFKIALVVLVLLVIAGVIGISYRLEDIIRKGVNEAGPKVMGVPVKLEKVELSFLKGRARLVNLEIGNPAGFKTAHAFKVDSFEVERSHEPDIFGHL